MLARRETIVSNEKGRKLQLGSATVGAVGAAVCILVVGSLLDGTRTEEPARISDAEAPGARYAKSEPTIRHKNEVADPSETDLEQYVANDLQKRLQQLQESGTAPADEEQRKPREDYDEVPKLATAADLLEQELSENGGNDELQVRVESHIATGLADEKAVGISLEKIDCASYFCKAVFSRSEESVETACGVLPYTANWSGPMLCTPPMERGGDEAIFLMNEEFTWGRMKKGG